VFLEIFITNTLPPELLGFIQVFGISKFVAVDRDALISVESEFLGLEQFIDVSDALLEAFEETAEDFARGPRVGITATIDRQIAESGAIFLELRQVALQEVQVLRIERFEVTIEKFAGNSAIERLLRVVNLLQQTGGDEGDFAVKRARLEFEMGDPRFRVGSGGGGGIGPRENWNLE